MQLKVGVASACHATPAPVRPSRAFADGVKPRMGWPVYSNRAATQTILFVFWRRGTATLSILGMRLNFGILDRARLPSRAVKKQNESVRFAFSPYKQTTYGVCKPARRDA